MGILSKLLYIPSPVKLRYTLVYSATANASGRMQYHKIKPNQFKERITRTQFIDAFNTLEILAVRPIQEENSPVFQLEFYV